MSKFTTTQINKCKVRCTEIKPGVYVFRVNDSTVRYTWQKALTDSTKIKTEIMRYMKLQERKSVTGVSPTEIVNKKVGEL